MLEPQPQRFRLGVTDLRLQLANHVRHILKRLLETPLLIGWLVIGTLLTPFVAGLEALAGAILNLLLMAFWVVLIRHLTPNSPAPVKIRRPRIELWVALGWLAVSFALVMTYHGLINLGPLMVFQSETIPVFVRTTAGGALPEWVVGPLVNAAQNTVTDLLPVIALFLALGYGATGMGLRLRYPKLILALLGVSILFGAPFRLGFFSGQPVLQVLLLYIIEIFRNGFHEELFFRGFLLPRLEPYLGGLNAIVVSAWLFQVIHIPSHIVQDGASVPAAILSSFVTAFPSGLIWGYLYYRTRSVIPGLLWHASFFTLGISLFGY